MLVKLHLKSQLSTTYNFQLTNEFKTRGQILAFQHTTTAIASTPTTMKSSVKKTIDMNGPHAFALKIGPHKRYHRIDELRTPPQNHRNPFSLSLSRLREREMPKKTPKRNNLQLYRYQQHQHTILPRCVALFCFVLVLFWLRCLVPWEMCGDGGRGKPYRNVNVRMCFAGSRGGIVLLRRPPP